MHNSSFWEAGMVLLPVPFPLSLCLCCVVAAGDTNGALAAMVARMAHLVMKPSTSLLVI